MDPSRDMMTKGGGIVGLKVLNGGIRVWFRGFVSALVLATQQMRSHKWSVVETLDDLKAKAKSQFAEARQTEAAAINC